MRVLMLGWEFPPHISGGLGTACYGMTSSLVKKHVDVLFVLPNCPFNGRADNGVTLQSASGFPISRVQYSLMQERGGELWREHMRMYAVDAMLFPYDTPESYAERIRWASGHARDMRLDPHSQSLTYDLHGGYGPDLMAEVHRFARLTTALALRESFDVIHAHDWMTYPAGMLASALTGKPLVAHIHATEYDRSGENVNSIVAEIERAGLLRADRVIAVSHRTKNTVCQRYGVPADKVEVVHNAVSRHEAGRVYNVPERLRHEKRVLFLGRITYQKGPEYFVEAARLVLEKMSDVRFFMAGSGDMLPRIIRRVSQLRLGSRFHFAGFLRGADVDRMFALSNLYVMPSVSEPFGITPLEAMLYDVPVLLSRQSGVSEVLAHALKADFWDTRDMADKICAVLRYPHLASTLVSNCHEEMKNIRWGNVAENLVAIYQSVCAAGGHSHASR